MVGREDVGRSLAHALSGGTNKVSYSYDSNHSIDVEIGFIVITNPMVQDASVRHVFRHPNLIEYKLTFDECI